MNQGKLEVVKQEMTRVNTDILGDSNIYLHQKSFSDSSVGKESTYNAGDPSSIPGLGRSAGEGIGYPFQYS